MKRIQRLLLCIALACPLAMPAPSSAAPNAEKAKSSFGAPAQERRISSGVDLDDLKRVDDASRKAAAQPSNELEARHYFRDRPDSIGSYAKAKEQKLLEELLADRENKVRERRKEALALLERFVAQEPEEAVEMADALLRLSELTWEVARIDYLDAYAIWQRTPEKIRKDEPPLPNYTRTIALYDRLLNKHPTFERLDLVLYMKAFTLVERGENDAALPLFHRILKDYPQSSFAPDAHMALAEHVFNTDYNFRAALVEYDQVLKYDESELYDLALFKSAWCLWQIGQKTEAAVRFRKVLDLDGERAAHTRRKRIKELQSEALEYLIQVFTEDERNRAADVRRFLQEIGGEQHVERVLIRLSATYYDQARFDQGIEAYGLLLQIDPASKHAPEYQLAIARGYLALDQFPKARDAYATLAETYGPTSTWATQQPDQETVGDARAMIEKALREQGLSLHELGQRDSRKEYFEQAADIYGIYLKHFDDSPESYRLTFYLGEILFHRLERHAEAGDVYMAAARKNPKGEFTKDALYNAIGAFERVREKEISRCTAAPNTPCAETENDKKFSSAIELYASYYPNDPDLPEILFRQGKFYYERHIYDPAVRLFGQLLDRYPNSSYAGDAGELVLDSFNRAADYQNIELWARKLKTAPAFKSAESQKRLNGLILGAVFKIGEQLASQNEHEAAADAYVRAAQEFPSDPRAPKAYYNAGLELSRAGQLAKADATYSTLVEKYPGTEEGALGAWNGAQMYESIAQFRDAARFYEAYSERFPKGPKASDAGYNAVLLRLSAHDYKAAVVDGKRFTDRFPKDDAVDDVYFLIGRAHEGEKAHAEAEGTYREYLRRTKNPDRRVEAYARLGQVLTSAGNRKGADAAFSDAVAEGRRNRKQLKGGRYYAAQARYLQGDEALREFDDVKIEGDLKGLGARLKLKAKLLGKAAGIYSEVVEFEVAEWVTGALYKIGRSYELFAKALADAPLPEGLNEEEQQVYRDELAMFIVPMEERALEAYEGGYKKARDLGIYNQWTVLMREGLTRMNDVEYPPIREIGGDIVRERALAQGPVIEGLRARETAAATPAVKVREDKPAPSAPAPTPSDDKPKKRAGKPGKAKEVKP
ncbi:MAG: tetratricopeptide repeat protein [Myxococcales bacterium]